MPPFKDPSFQERVSRAAAAKQAALEKLRAKPPVDPAVQAERAAARATREQAEAEKRAERKAAQEQAKADKLAAAEAAEAAKAKAKVSLPTEQELKAARDARYAARKARK